MIEIIPTVYDGNGKFGDFNWMIKQAKYIDSLFVFNDSIVAHETCEKGGGNAIIRQYNIHSDYKIPRSAGIPTGYSPQSGGFKGMNDAVKSKIDSSISEIKDIIKKYNYKKIYYSVNEEGDVILGTTLFVVSEDVLKYITRELYKLRAL